MARLGTVTFSGESGSQYKFNAYELGTAFKVGLGAVYVVTRRGQREDDGAFTHKRIRLGQADDIRRPLAMKKDSFAERGGNCICVHAEKDKAARLGIQQDLIRKRHSDGDGEA